MKKGIIMTAAVLTASILSFTGCGGDDKSSGNSEAAASKPLSEITADVINCGVEFPEMVEVSEDNFQIKYGLTADDYDEFSLWWAGSGADADEVCIIKAKDADKVKTAVTNRIQGQKDVFKDYVPEQYDRLCESDVKTKGSYVYWVCSNDNSKSEKAITDDFS